MSYLPNSTTTTPLISSANVLRSCFTYPNTTVKIATTNRSGLSEAKGVRDLTDLDKIEFTFYTFTFLIGITGNVLVVLTLLRWRKATSLKHLFILNLAITDIITLLFSLPITVMGKFISWPFGEFACRYIFPMTDVVIGTSIFTMVCISLERYRAITCPLSSKPSGLQCGIILISIWVISYLAVGLPLSFFLELGPSVWVKTACILEWPSPQVAKIYYMQRILILYIIPTIVILGAYIRINVTLRRNLIFVRSSLSGQARENRIRNQRRLIRVFLVIFLAFAICFLPLQIVTFLLAFYVKIWQWRGVGHFYIACILFAFANSACNPLILAIMSGEFRNGFKSFFPCCFKLTANCHATGRLQDDGILADSQKESIISKALRRLSGFRQAQNSAVTIDIQVDWNNFELQAHDTNQNYQRAGAVNAVVEDDVYFTPQCIEIPHSVTVEDTKL